LRGYEPVKSYLLQYKKGETSWETKAARKIRKRVRSRTPKNRNNSQKTSKINSQKENPDRNISEAPIGIRNMVVHGCLRECPLQSVQYRDHIVPDFSRKGSVCAGGLDSKTGPLEK
jgi:hypothetical protein